MSSDKHVPKFDKQAAIEQAKHEDSDGYFGFLTGAEWQFERDKARIELAEKERDAARSDDELHASVDYWAERGKSAERERDRLQIRLLDLELMVDDLRKYEGK